jgi:hypothetical protein
MFIDSDFDIFDVFEFERSIEICMINFITKRWNISTRNNSMVNMNHLR